MGNVYPVKTEISGKSGLEENNIGRLGEMNLFRCPIKVRTTDLASRFNIKGAVMLGT